MSREKGSQDIFSRNHDVSPASNTVLASRANAEYAGFIFKPGFGEPRRMPDEEHAVERAVLLEFFP